MSHPPPGDLAGPARNGLARIQQLVSLAAMRKRLLFHMRPYLRRRNFAMAALSMAGAVLAFVAGYPPVPAGAPSLRLERIIDLPRTGMLSALDYIAIRGQQLFVTSISSGDIYAVALGDPVRSGSLVRVLGGAGTAHGIAISDGDTGFVTRSSPDRADLFDPASLVPLQSVSLPAGPDAALYDPQGKNFYVASGNARIATLVNAETGKLSGTIDLPGTPEFAVRDMRTGLVYQNLADIDAVAAIDLHARKVIGVWPLAPCQEPTGLAIDEGSNRLFVVCSASRELVSVDLASHAVIDSVPLGRLSDSVAFDPVFQRLYVAGGAGDLAIISVAPNHHFVQHVRTRIGAHTVAVDPATHKVYLACGGILAAPFLAVFTPMTLP